MTSDPLRVVICGMGFMGKTHASLWASLPQVEVVGIVEQRPASQIAPILREQGLNPDLSIYPDLKSACEQQRPDIIDLCTPTHLHREQAGQAFAFGCHVFCEKPIALNLNDADAMLKAAALAQRELMIGHCIRFWPEYETLAKTIAQGNLGALLFLDMRRTAGRPAYAVDSWTNDPERCFGAALDMHIHDVDWIHETFGLPKSVSSQGLKLKTGWDYLATQYHYDHPFVITARGGWCLPLGAPFRMAYQAVFERGMLEYDSAIQDGVKLTTENENSLLPSEASEDALVAYRRQLAYFADCLQKGIPVSRANGQQAFDSLRLVLTEIASAESGQIQQISPLPKYQK